MKNKIKKELKKHITGVTLFFAVLFLVLGVVVGFLGYNIVNKDKDYSTKIELNGDEVINLSVNENYEELGATFIINGVDYKNEVVVSGEVDTQVEGTYVVTYTLSNESVNIVLKRLVNVGGDSNGN